MNFGQTSSDVNYEPSVHGGTAAPRHEAVYSQSPLIAKVQQQRIEKTLDFQQAGELYRSFLPPMQANLIANLAGDLKQVRDRETRLRLLSFFYQADESYGMQLSEAVGDRLEDVKASMTANQGVDPLRLQQFRRDVDELRGLRHHKYTQTSPCEHQVFQPTA